MMTAVLSGKGGTGKTFVSVNLAAVAETAVYIDCDVEEPDGFIFFKPVSEKTENVYKSLPSFDEKKCTGCRDCVQFCKFNALAFIGKKPMVFPEVCHDCGGCSLVCKSEAVTYVKKEIGRISEGFHSNVKVISGTLHIGEASGIPVIKKALKKGMEAAGTGTDIIADCPPGSACSVMETIKDADYCVLVAEPTAFGLHNLNMVYELVRVMNKKCGLVINKDTGNSLIDDFCKKNNVPLLARIPYSRKTAEITAAGKIAVESDDMLKDVFRTLLHTIREAAV